MSDEELQARGWDAITAALKAVHGNAEPLHWGTIVRASLGGPDPLDGISAYVVESPRHWHYVTYGMSELYGKESDVPDVSGWGIEFTFRLARRPAEDPPGWVLNFLNNLARYVYETGNVFGAGHHLDLNGPIALEQETAIRAIVFAIDPQLGTFSTPNGRITFLQIVGLTYDELHAVQGWDSSKFLELVARRSPMFLTDLERRSLLEDAVFSREVEEGAVRDGSSEPVAFVSKVEWSIGTTAELTLGAAAVRQLLHLVPRRLPYGRPFSLASGTHTVLFEPADKWSWRGEPDALVIALPHNDVREFCARLAVQRGLYTWDRLPGFTLKVIPSHIKDHEGNVVEVIG